MQYSDEQMNRYRARVLAVLSSAGEVVYNSEWADAKDCMNRLIEGTKDGWSKVYLARDREGEPYDKYNEWYYGSPYTNQLENYVKKIEAKLTKPGWTNDPLLIDLRDRMKPLVEMAVALTALKDRLKKGKRPIDPSDRKIPIRTLDHTGTCGVCGMNVKIEGKGLYNHRFTIEFGQRLGRCFGVGYEPDEISPKANREYVDKVLKPYRNREREMATWLRGDVSEITSHFRTSGYKGIIPIYLVAKKGDALFDQIVREEISYHESNQEMAEREISRREQELKTWKARVLPGAQKQSR